MSISFSTDTGEVLVRVQEPPKNDGRPGKSITFGGASLRPLGYTELVQAHVEKTLTIPLDWDDAQLVDTNIEGLDKNILYTAKAALESRFTSRAIGLVKGGWLPPTLAATNKTTILIDRNIVTQIVGRFDSGKVVGTDPDFLDLFADRPVRINPVLSAMEGNARAIPTVEQIREQLNEVVTKLKAALPAAKLVVGPDSLTGALGLLDETRAGMAKKQQFLMRVAPGLAAPVGKKDMLARRDAVLTIADQCGVFRGSLVVIAVLSAVDAARRHSRI
jgi:hypothetical protein